MLLRLAGRLISLLILLIVLIFLVSLAINLGQEGNLGALRSAVPSAARFTTDYLKGLVHGDLGIIASGRRAIASTPVTTELGRALPKSLGLMAFALTLAALVDNQPPPIDSGRYLRLESLPSLPNLLIGESAARQILAEAGADLDELQAKMETGEQIALHTGL